MVLSFEIRIVQVIGIFLAIPVMLAITVLLKRRQKLNCPVSILAPVYVAAVAIMGNLSVLVIYPESFQEAFFEDAIWWFLTILGVGLTLHFAEKKGALTSPRTNPQLQT